MRTAIALGLLLTVSLPAAAQTVDVYGEKAGQERHPWEMIVPPPVSGAAYATVVGAEEASNYLRTGLTLSGGYIQNLNPGSGSQSINDGMYLVQPTLAIDRTSTRSHTTVTYEPAFTWYQPTSLNTADHAVTADVNLRLSPHVGLRAGETLNKSTSAFGRLNPTFQAPVTGSTAFVTPGIVGLFVPEVTNETMAGLTWQFDRNRMIAGSGWLNLLHVTDKTQAQGLYNTQTRGGSGALIQRVGREQYLGGMYQYTTTQANPLVATQTNSSVFETNNIFGFYTAYPQPQISLSLQGGAQYYTLTDRTSSLHYQKWTPAGSASIDWHGYRTGLAITYSRLGTAGEGAVGGFMTNAAVGSATWEMAPHWTLALGGGYTNIGNLLPVTTAQVIQNGHTVSGTAVVGHDLTPNLRVSGSYARLHQSYGNVNIPAITNSPDSDRVLVSLTYLLSRPIGR